MLAGLFIATGLIEICAWMKKDCIGDSKSWRIWKSL